AARGWILHSTRSYPPVRTAAQEAGCAERGRARRGPWLHLPHREESGPVDPAVHRNAVTPPPTLFRQGDRSRSAPRGPSAPTAPTTARPDRPRHPPATPRP